MHIRRNCSYNSFRLQHSETEISLVFDTLTKDQISAFEEIVANALKETFPPLSPVLRKKLVKHRKLLRKLILKSTTHSQSEKKILIKLQHHIIAILIDSTSYGERSGKNDSFTLD
jgi:hypothetical protein